MLLKKLFLPIGTLWKNNRFKSSTFFTKLLIIYFPDEQNYNEISIKKSIHFNHNEKIINKKLFKTCLSFFMHNFFTDKIINVPFKSWLFDNIKKSSIKKTNWYKSIFFKSIVYNYFVLNKKWKKENYGQSNKIKHWCFLKKKKGLINGVRLLKEWNSNLEKTQEIKSNVVTGKLWFLNSRYVNHLRIKNIGMQWNRDD